MNYATNDLCQCANCPGQACQCGCQLAATAPAITEAQSSCVCGGSCGCSASGQHCLCNEWKSF